MPGRNKSNSGFKLGNRLGQGRHHHVEADASFSLPCLRPRQHRPCPTEMGKMRLVHQDKLQQMWNLAIREHMEGHLEKFQSPPQFHVVSEVKHGVVVKQSLGCTKKTCGYSTPICKLYDEVLDDTRRGPKAAVPNVALDMETVNSSIGPATVRRLLSAMDIPVPAESVMHKRGKDIQEKIVQAAEEDMLDKLTEVSGPEKKVIVSMDTRYNTTGIRTSRRTGLCTTSQAETLAIEQNSPQKYIVGVDIQNKLCAKGAFLRAKGEKNVICGIEGQSHCGCTANLTRFESLSEAVGAERIGHKIASAGVSVTEVITDGDSRLHAGLQKAMANPVVRRADPVHLGQTQIKHFKKKQVSNTLFGSIVQNNKSKRFEYQCTLAADLKNRSSIALKHMHQKHEGNTDLMKKEMPAVVDCILKCYCGDCSACPVSSAGTCRGEDGDCWFTRSSTLSAPHITALKPTTSDLEAMKDVLLLMLSDKGIEATKGLNNTQLNEAANRCLSSTAPKNIKWSSSINARVASAILTWNGGRRGSAILKRQVLKLPAASDAQDHFLKQCDKRREYFKQRAKNPKQKARRYKADVELRQARWRHKSQSSDYKKHQFTTETSTSTEMEPLDHHNYSKSTTK